MTLHRLTLALAAVLVAGTCAYARAAEETHSDDVSILTCRGERSFGPDTRSTAMVETGHGVRIVFENRGTADLSDVTFAVEEGGGRVVREDVGRFSPGARIDHYFAAEDLPEVSAPICSVFAVAGKP